MKRNAYSPKGICYYSQLMAFMKYFYSAYGENSVKTLSSESYEFHQIMWECRIPFQKTTNEIKSANDVRNQTKQFR